MKKQILILTIILLQINLICAEQIPTRIVPYPNVENLFAPQYSPDDIATTGDIQTNINPALGAQQASTYPTGLWIALAILAAVIFFFIGFFLGKKSNK